MTSKEALEVLNNPMKKEHWDLQNEAYNLLTDLVERDTPVKIVDTGIGGSYCKKCRKSKHYDSFGNRNNFCGGCGQKLKW